MKPHSLLWLSVALPIAFAPAITPAAAQEQPKLEQVAAFDHQVTGVTVSEDNRIFVNFPRWTDDAPVSVAEVKPDGTIAAYPNDQWNAWRNAKRYELGAGDHFVCVQSVVADKRGSLFVLDAAAPAQSHVVAGGPKLVQIDLKTNEVSKTYKFDETVAPQGSYLNDVRFSPDGKFAYITDSGVKGAIVVLNLDIGKAWRALDGHKSTQVEPEVVVSIDNKPLRQPDGRGVEFSADGIALSKDGKWLHWQAIKGRTLYRIDTAALQDEAITADDLAQKVQRVGENGVADGLLIAGDGAMIVTAPEQNALLRREGEADPTMWVQDEQLIWPDTLSEAPDGTIYVTSSRIQDMSWFKPGNPASLPTKLFRVPAAKN